MAYLIGTDEAGYGPNLGPLVIAASVWHIAGEDWDVDLYEALGDLVVDHATLAPTQLAIADSKRLYRPGGDLAQLERGVLTLLGSQQSPPPSWERLRSCLGDATVQQPRRVPWQEGADIALPTSAARFDSALAVRCQRVLEEARVRFLTLRATVVEPEEFNAGLIRYDSKGALLSNLTLDLIAEVIGPLGDEPIRVVCDKHGGRNRYAPLLQPRFGDRLVRVVSEGRHASVYQVETTRSPLQIAFQVGGESFLPSALASMTAKFLRELSMRAFNDYWQRQVSGLKPTAGYPVDARRFWEQIRPTQQRLGIDDQLLWRQR